MYKQFSCVALFFICNASTLSSNPIILSPPEENNPSPILSLAWAGDDSLYSASQNGFIRSWDVRQGTIRQSFQLPIARKLASEKYENEEDEDEGETRPYIVNVLFESHDEVILVLSNATVIIYNLTWLRQDGYAKQKVDFSYPNEELTYATLIPLKSLALASWHDGRVTVRIDGADRTLVSSGPLEILTHTTHEDKKYLVGVTKTDFICWRGKQSTSFNARGHIQALEWIDSQTLVCAFANKYLEQLNIKALQDVPNSRIDLEGSPCALALDPSGSTLAVGTMKGMLLLIDTKQWSIGKTLEVEHAKKITTLSWSEDGTQLAAGTKAGKIIIWNIGEKTTKVASTPRFKRKQKKLKRKLKLQPPPAPGSAPTSPRLRGRSDSALAKFKGVAKSLVSKK